jgi:hypothetical protein
MNIRGLYWKIGLGLCMTGVFWILCVQEAWEHTTFHPSWELDTPGLLVGLGVVFIATCGFMTLLERLLRRRAIRRERHEARE